MRGTAPAMKATDVWNVLRTAITLPGSIGIDVGKTTSISLSDNLLISADLEETGTQVSDFKKKEIVIYAPGEYRVSFDLKSADAEVARAAVFKNAGIVGVYEEQANTWATKTADFTFLPNDLIQLYAKKGDSTAYFIRNFRLYGDIVSVIGVVQDE